MLNGSEVEIKADACSYSFSSDSIIHSYSKWKRYQHIISQIPKKEIEEFIAIGSTIGGYIIFPKDRIDGLNTINQERGTNNYICDRFDLTLECIRLFYLNQNSPLYDCLLRYKDFFDLFVDFKGYVEFFLLNDIVDDTFSKIDFFYRDESFKESPLPTSKEEYFDYRNKVIKFVNKRNKRIQIIR